MRAWLLAAASIAVLTALVFARPHPTPGPPMRDFEAYYAAGALWNSGGDPYSQAIWSAEKALPGVDSRRYEALPFVGPPAALPVMGLIARMPFDAANALWRAILIVALAALALATLRLAQRPITPRTFLAIAVAALGFGPLTSALALGQIALPAFLFAVCALLWRPAGVFAWLQPNVGLTLLWQLLNRRGAAAFIASLAVFGAACVAVAGIGGIEHYAAVVHRHALAERFSAIQITPASIAYGFGAPVQVAMGIATAVTVLTIGYWAVLIRSLRGEVERFCATCALLPLAMPFFHEHDLLVLFVPALVYASSASARLWPAAAGGALLAATDWLGLAQRPDAALQTILLIAALGMALVALHERPQMRMLLVPGAVLALIGGTALLAHAHPAPIWPDAMGALPSGTGGTDISAAWAAQQRATGLFAQNALWSALRSLSLLGCVLTAVTIGLSSRSPADSRSPSPVPA